MVAVLLAMLLATLDAGRLLAGVELAGVLLREELLKATELLERLEITGSDDEAGWLELLTGVVALGLVPTKYRSGAAGVAMPSPRKKLVCGGWLYATFCQAMASR